MATKSKDTGFIEIFNTFFEDFHKHRLQLLFLLTQALSSVNSIIKVHRVKKKPGGM